MRKNTEGVIKLIVSLCLLAFAASAMWTFMDHMLRPQAYAVNSAPWYTEVLVNGLLCLLCAGISWLIGFIVDKIQQKKEERSKNNDE